ncbi:MAG: HAD-IIA family hydrolase [Acidimicrobiia bacterium]|nr:HAD-IIA family hydrolase [Acidimicrobiia bacterium]
MSTTSGESTGLVCCDLDGVIWRGDEPIEAAIAGVAELRAAGVRVAFVSNNSSQPIRDVAAKLERLGVATDPADVLTSALAAARLLAQSLAPGAPVLVCAGPGVTEALVAEGLQPVDRPPAEAVVVGFHRSFDFDELDRASRAIREGARFISANLDATYPVPGGLMPGSGAITAAVAVASGRQPEVAGKPEAPMVDLVRARLGSHGIVVGDRPSSDGALADALGWPFALVLTGVTAAVAPPGGEAIPDPAPPFVGDDLGALVPALLSALANSA